MITVVLLGSGNVAYHLALALKSTTQVDLIQRYSRSGNNSDLFDTSIPTTNNLQQLEKADIYIIAIKDEAIASFSHKISHLQGLVVHTSGSIAMDKIDVNLKRGVLYPVQTFTLQEPLNFKTVPLAIEAESKTDFDLLHTLANRLSEKVYPLNSSEREKLHLSAVFANNFSNYMFTCAHDICKEFNLPFDILKPIILESGKKIQNIEPLMAQTGPAKRNDTTIIAKHLEMLAGEKKDIYKFLSKTIMETYQTEELKDGKKL